MFFRKSFPPAERDGRQNYETPMKYQKTFNGFLMSSGVLKFKHYKEMSLMPLIAHKTLLEIKEIVNDTYDDVIVDLPVSF